MTRFHETIPKRFGEFETSVQVQGIGTVLDVDECLEAAMTNVLKHGVTSVHHLSYPPSTC